MKKLLLAGLVLFLVIRAPAARFPLFAGMDFYSRPIDTRSAEAQQYFDQGLALLYAYNYEDALRSFQAATELDAESPMAWWGVAAACGPHINNPSVNEARNALALDALRHAHRLAPRAQPVEQALIEAQARRFAVPWNADRSRLDESYAAAMRDAWKKFPADADLGAMFAEALMDLRPWDQWTFEGEPQPGTLEIIATLEAVLRLVPNHPQALHLYIHALEGSKEPSKAADAAGRLRQLHPGAAHLLHMPSHIDVLVGRWDDAVTANEHAVAADDAIRAHGGTTRGNIWLLNAHHRHMLAFAAMMSGRSELALRTMREMAEGWPEQFPPDLAPRMDPYAAMPLEVMVRFGRWDEILTRPLPDHSLPVSLALAHAARGIAHAARNEVAAARADQDKFKEAAQAVPAKARFWNTTAHEMLNVAGAMLDGEVLFRAGNTDQGLARLREAVQAEMHLPYDEPPDWILPARHALGAALLQVGRVQEAEQVYRDDLARWPGNGWSLFGLARALKFQQRDAEAATVEKQFKQAWIHGDFELRSSCLCQPGQ